MNSLLGNIPIIIFISFFIISLFILGISIFFRFLYNLLQMIIQQYNLISHIADDIQAIRVKIEEENIQEDTNE